MVFFKGVWWGLFGAYKKREIIDNEVVIGELSISVIQKLQEYNVIVETKEIYLSVKAYNHQLRTFKQKKGKAYLSIW